MKTGIGKANGKIILIGEHAVVYGEKAIALPFFPTSCKVIVKDDIENIISSSIYIGLVKEAPLQMEAIVTLIKKLINEFKLPSLHYQIDSNISIAAGMGSSAAIASAIVEAVYDYLDKDLPNETRFNWIQFSETIAHGNPSGIDALATTHNNAWVFQKGKEPIKFDTKLNAYLTVGESGELGNTKEAVSHVKRLIDEENMMFLIKEIGVAVEEALLAYKSGNVIKLGKSMSSSQKILKSLGVSTERIDKLVDMAISSGALGAKLTGGGLGGCVIAIAGDEKTANNIKAIWEKETLLTSWVLNLNEE